MNFKEKYAGMQQDIVPDKEFLDRLALKMEQQKRQNRRRRLRMIFISAGSVCVSAAAALIIVFNVPKGPTNPPVHLTENGDKISYQEGAFSSGEIFDQDRPLPEQLCEMLSDDNTLLYESGENTFDYDDKLSDELREELASRIESAEEASSELGGSVMYYMAVLENGDVVKFRISEDVLEIGGQIFKIS